MVAPAGMTTPVPPEVLIVSTCPVLFLMTYAFSTDGATTFRGAVSVPLMTKIAFRASSAAPLSDVNV
jgi:hypothetical protein